MKLTPTIEQQEIINNAINLRTGNLMIQALAGSAKTTTLTMIAAALPPSQYERRLALAFNVKIRDALKDRLPKSFETLTINGLGHRAWQNLLGRQRRLDVNRSKLYKITEETHAHFKPNVRKLLNAARVFGLVPGGKAYHTSVKRFLADELDSWQKLGEFCDIPEATLDPEWAAKSEDLIGITRERLIFSIEEAYNGRIDFADQIYMPSCFGGAFNTYDFVMVDEAQDLSLINHFMLKKVTGRKLIAVGDRNQSMYAFRGADHNSMDVLREMFNMKELHLTTCFRCDRAIVTEARQYAPSMQPAPTAGQGQLTYVNSPWGLDFIKPNSAVICRNNAPLFRLFFAFMKAGQSVNFVGAQIAERIKAIIEKIDGQQNLPRMAIIQAFEEHIEGLPEDKRDFLVDVAEVVAATPGRDTNAILASLDKVLNAQTGNINLSTGHRAKGLEWDVVYHLDSWRLPSKYSKTPAQLQQENNIAYVITTRARHQLTYLDMQNYVEGVVRVVEEDEGEELLGVGEDDFDGDVFDDTQVPTEIHERDFL